jgi:V/A-type H+-transporting ATPase subunit E
MNAEQVVEKILAEARAEAEKITAAAGDKCAAAEAELKSQLADYEKQTEGLAAQAAEDKKARMLATANMEIKKEYLTAKVALLDDVFNKVRERIKTLSDKEYEDLITSLMTKAVETGDEQVMIGAEEKRIDHALIKQVNRKLGPGYKGNLSLAQDRANIDGGFILRRGKIQVNVSIEVLLAEARDKFEIELAEELFAEESS